MAIERRLVAAQRVPTRARAEAGARVEEREVVREEARRGGPGAQAAEGEESRTAAGLVSIHVFDGGGGGGGGGLFRARVALRRKRPLPLLDQRPGALVDGVVDGDDGGDGVGEGVGCAGGGGGSGRGGRRCSAAAAGEEEEALRVVLPQHRGEELLLRWVDPVPGRVGAGFALRVGGAAG